MESINLFVYFSILINEYYIDIDVSTFANNYLEIACFYISKSYLMPIYNNIQ
jgi:hypothetical protein